MTDDTPWPQMDKGRPVADGDPVWRQPPAPPPSVFDRIKGAFTRSAPEEGVPPDAAIPPVPEPDAPGPDSASPDAAVEGGADQNGAAVAAEPAPGEPAVPPRPCRECGGPVDADGYCTQCGARAPSAREHFEEAPARWVGAVCDRGVRHARNEDAVATAADPAWGSRAVLVVCDGVTTSDDSDVAALAAARAARDSLRQAILDTATPESGTAASRMAEAASALTQAAARANNAVAAHTAPDALNPAACTFVAAIVEEGTAFVGNVGDSRAYWLPDAGEGRILTRDDSLAEDSIASGTPRKQAEEAADAHTITRWLGVDAVDVLPHVARAALDGPGWVLVCSDGLWNYASEPAQLATALAGAIAAADPPSQPVDVARKLVDWAIAQGGHDNISACLARLGVPEPPEPVAEPDAEAEVEPAASDATVKIVRLSASDTPEPIVAPSLVVPTGQNDIPPLEG